MSILCGCINCEYSEPTPSNIDICNRCMIILPTTGELMLSLFRPKEKKQDTIKEEVKMSDVKITYKPVDKKEQAFGIIESFVRVVKGAELSDFGICSVKAVSDAIDSIYNSKEEDREIEEIKLVEGGRDLKIGKISFALDHAFFVSITGGNFTNTVSMSKQETHDLGQALIKMSEQV